MTSETSPICDLCRDTGLVRRKKYQQWMACPGEGCMKKRAIEALVEPLSSPLPRTKWIDR